MYHNNDINDKQLAAAKQLTAAQQLTTLALTFKVEFPTEPEFVNIERWEDLDLFRSMILNIHSGSAAYAQILLAF